MIVYLHVGAAKTGTTYMQRLLWKNRRALADDGICYPGDHWKSHYWAALDLRETRFKDYPDPNIPGAWVRLVDHIRRWEGQTAIIDHELFAHATSEQIDRALKDLEFAEVHVLYTVRDLARQLPAVWQESIKNGATMTFADFLARVRDPESRTGRGRRFWRSNDYPRVLARWAHSLPLAQVHVITVPPSGTSHDVLWERFATVTGLDPRRYEQGEIEANASLGAAEVGALRRLNLAISGKDLDWPTYAGTVKGFLCHRVLGGRPGRQKIILPADEYSWVHTRASEMVRQLTDAGYDVVGDLAELIPPEPHEDAYFADPDGVSAEDQLEAAAEAMAGLLERTASLRQRNEKAKRRAANQAKRARTFRAQASRMRAERDRALTRPGRVRAAVGDHRWRSTVKRFKRTVVRLGDRVHVIGQALAAYRRIRAFARAKRSDAL